MIANQPCAFSDRPGARGAPASRARAGAPRDAEETAADGDGAWRAQLRAAVRSLDALLRVFPGLEITPEMREAEKRFPMAATPHYLSLVREASPDDPILRQCLPAPGELAEAPWTSLDPLGESPCSPVPRLVRRYPDRAVVLVCSSCATLCRHCFRKALSGAPAPAISDAELSAVAEWLRANPEVEDVLLSGGDPLTLPDERVAAVLEAVAGVPSVKVVRVATRLPATLPQRFTPSLVRLLASRPGGAAVYASSHFNHPRELSPEALDACARLVDAGVPVQNQTVLLRGVNDDPATLEALFRALYRNRVRPYYLFQTDLVRGIEHLRTPLAVGLGIMRTLRARLSGPAIPNFCVDPPGLAGKIELAPDSVVSRRPGATLLRSSSGTLFEYPDPAVPEAPPPPDSPRASPRSGEAVPFVPSAPSLALRARAVRAVRAWLDGAGFVEVETPVRVRAPANEPHIRPPASGGAWLRASPELHMKRLLAAGMERIYQIGPCFREGELGDRHSPEFTMLEWYRRGGTWLDLMDDVRAFCAAAARAAAGSETVRFRGADIDLGGEWERIPVREAYRRWAGWDPVETWDAERFDLDMALKVEPALPRDRPLFLVGYPAQAASLARLSPDDPRLAERWEAYVGGMELANAFGELVDPAEQRARFVEAAREKAALGEPVFPLDEPFLAALGSLPPSAGAALGVDRLAMVLADAPSIAAVRAFVPETAKEAP